jgi:large subunit ribosomal protein L18
MANLSIRKRRSKVKISYNIPVIVVSRSNKNMNAQLISAVEKKTVFTVQTYKLKGTKSEQAVEMGKVAAKKLQDLKIDRVVFDRNGILYHGRIKAFADSLRENGITI